MEKKSQPLCSTALSESKRKIPGCKICFQPINEHSLYNIVNGYPICDKCMKAFNPVFGKEKINGKYKLYYLYNYDQNIRDLIYRYKGCNDYELKDAFIKRFSFWLKMQFSGYIVVPAPSSKEKEVERGFQHVEEVFASLKFKINQCFIKTSDFKQSSLTASERKEVASKLEIVNGQSVKGKRILIVDDIYTTGSTVKAMISKLEPYHPRDIKVLVVAKTIYNPNKAHNNNLE